MNKGDKVKVLKNDSCMLVGQEALIVGAYTRHEGYWLYQVQGWWSDRDNPEPVLGVQILTENQMQLLK